MASHSPPWWLPLALCFGLLSLNITYSKVLRSSHRLLSTVALSVASWRVPQIVPDPV